MVRARRAAALPRWWPVILAGSGAAAWVLAAFGAKLGIPARLERLYAAVTVLACGTWVTLAAVLGPFTAPLPQALGIGTLLLAVPWWTNRRRRAKVRVGRAIAAWPDIARNAGLDGSQVMNAAVDLWGWRARLRLARGQTITDVTAKIPALESGLGTQRGAVRVYPTPDDLANRCELRVLDRDPHADAIPWPGPSVTSVTQPIDLGPFEDAEPCRVLFLRRHAILAGATGSGKSGGLNELMANLAACGDVVIWAIDLKRGMELRPWARCIDRLATTSAEAAALLADAVTVLYARAEHLADHGLREWEPSETAPALVIIVDEYAELAEQAPRAMKDTDTIARLGRAPAVTLVAATQRPTQKVMGQGAVRSQMNIRIAFRIQEQRDVDLVLGQGMLKAGWQAHKLNAPGKFLVSSPEHDTPPPRPRLPPHRPGRNRRRRTLRPRPPPARRHLTNRAHHKAGRPRHPGTTSGQPRRPPGRRTRRRPGSHLVGRPVSRPGRGDLRPRTRHRNRHEPPLGLLPATRTRRSRTSHPDRAQTLAHRAPGKPAMTGRAVVHVHPPACVSARKRAYTHPAQARPCAPRAADGTPPATAEVPSRATRPRN
jgi:S-DNA-T family DNA segregation ATPase FtsK/SpoIIIE